MNARDRLELMDVYTIPNMSESDRRTSIMNYQQASESPLDTLEKLTAVVPSNIDAVTDKLGRK